ncbi:MAG: CYTH domain-containing protein [Ferruginibacter sp.]
MGKEIERKYLVDHMKWQQAEKGRGEIYRQGYLLTDPGKTIRVRLTESAGYITIKGLSVGAVRPEYEYEIPAGDAKELLDQFAIAELSKTRYKIMFGNKTWEVDVFAGRNEGLIVAEVELESEDEAIEIPAWITKEVTGDEKYYNSNLTQHPFKNW